MVDRSNQPTTDSITDLLIPVNWNAWRNQKPAPAPVTLSETQVRTDPSALSEVERVALLVIRLNSAGKELPVQADGKQLTKQQAKQHTAAVAKIVRMALREIEQAVLTCEQDIDYL